MDMQALRHSASHVMAQAVMRLYPDVKIAIGPAIEDGFYYDFEFTEKISDTDLEKISAEMRKIADEAHKFIQKDISR